MWSVAGNMSGCIQPTVGPDFLQDNLTCFAIITQKNFGLIYVCFAIVPFFFLRRMQPVQRRWMFGLSGIFLSLSLFMAYILNPYVDRTSLEMYPRYFSPSHLVLSILAGCGLSIAGPLLTSSRQR